MGQIEQLGAAGFDALAVDPRCTDLVVEYMGGKALNLTEARRIATDIEPGDEYTAMVVLEGLAVVLTSKDSHHGSLSGVFSPVDDAYLAVRSGLKLDVELSQNPGHETTAPTDRQVQLMRTWDRALHNISKES